MGSRGLTPRQQRFIDELVANPADKYGAAQRAGYEPGSVGQLMANPMVRQELQLALADVSERARVDAAWLLNRLAEEVDADIADLFIPGTQVIKPVHEWPAIWRRGLVTDVEVNPLGLVTRVKLSDRLKRLELIGKHIDVSAFRDNVQHSGRLELAAMSDEAIEQRIDELLAKRS